MSSTRGAQPAASEALPDIPDKHTFKIGEVARLVGVKTHVLRFWEREFASIRPRKGSNGHRLYSRGDVEQLRDVRALLHERRMTIAGARALLDQGDEAVQSMLVGAPVEAASALEAAQAEQAALQAQLGNVQAQVKRLERAVSRAEEEAQYWRAAAQTAESKLDVVATTVAAEVEQLAALFSVED